MERKSVSSSCISSIGYDPETGELEVEFVKGGVYTYSGVDMATADAFTRASSPGQFFVSNIKSSFSGQRA